MVMEYLDGSDFASILAQRVRLSVAEVIEYILQALEGLAEAHEAGIVHRDLKPADLFLTLRADQFPLVKVLDFGISKTFRPELTHSKELTKPSTILGSPLYMSPEQLRDARSVDARSDIWAIGVVLYEFLTGVTPFDGSSFIAISASIARDPPRPISTLRRNVPAELEAVILRCLAKNPADRYASVMHLARAFRPLATTLASQVSLSHILKLGSIPPTSKARPTARLLTLDGARAHAVRTRNELEADTCPASIPFEETPTRQTASSLQPLQTSNRPRAPERRGLSLALLLGAVAVVTWTIFGLRSSGFLAPQLAAPGSTMNDAASAVLPLSSSPIRASPKQPSVQASGPALPAPSAKRNPPDLRVGPVHRRASIVDSSPPFFALENVGLPPARSSARSEGPPIKPPRTLDAENPFDEGGQRHQPGP